MTKARSPIAPVVVLLWFAWGCSSTDTSSGTLNTTVRDSAGVTIVENGAPNGDARLSWVVGSTPRTDVGSLDGEEAYQLFRVRDAIQLDDGRLAVANSGSGEVRVFGGNGEHLANWGRQGEGPGEFRNPWRLKSWPSDSVGVWDRRLRRVTIFDSGGTLGRTVDLVSGDWSGLLEWVDVFPDGTLLVTHQNVFGQEPVTGITRNPVSVSTLSESGQLLMSSDEKPGDEVYLKVGEGTLDLLRLPFAKSFRALRVGEEIMFSSTDDFEFNFYDRNARLTRVVRLAVPARRVTESDIAADNERQLAAVDEDARAQVRARQADTPRPETFPAFSDVLVDPLQNLWVQVFQPPAEEAPRAWAVFDAYGTFLGYVETPAGLTVFQIGMDFVLGVQSDDLGVEHVQTWPMIRG